MLIQRSIAALLAALTGLLTGCGPAAAPDLEGFQSLTLSITGSMANRQEYEVLRTAEGVTLSYYDGWWDWDDPDGREAALAKRIDGGEDQYQTVLTLLNDCGAAGWDGFSKSDPNILDGEMFSLEIVLDKQHVISAHGSNAYPNGYHSFYQGLMALFDSGA